MWGPAGLLLTGSAGAAGALCRGPAGLILYSFTRFLTGMGAMACFMVRWGPLVLFPPKCCIFDPIECLMPYLYKYNTLCDFMFGGAE